MGSISFDPFKTQGSSVNFTVDSNGLTQGDAQDDPAVRLKLASGVVTGTDPMWGGVGIIELIPAAMSKITGSKIAPATATSCSGFTVFNQAYHGITTPSSQVPQYTSGGSVHYYRLGSGARIPLQISAAVAALATDTVAMDANKFAWDPTNNWIDIDNTNGMPLKLLAVSTTGNLAAVQDPTTKSVNWDTTKPVGLFLI